MTVNVTWRPALAALLATALLLGGCSTTDKDGSPQGTAERLYREARDDIDAGSYERAIKALERVEGLAAGTLLAQQALLDLSYANWRMSERTAALTAVDRFLKLNPSSPAVDYALYLKGMINFAESLGLVSKVFGQDLAERDQRAARDSYQAFKQLVERFPQSRYTPDAQQRMTFIVHLLADNEVHVARYYFRRGAYVAAVARAQQAVSEFPQSPASEEALFILMQSYNKLGMNDLRDGADRVLRKNYPDSRWLKEGVESQTARPWWKLF